MIIIINIFYTDNMKGKYLINILSSNLTTYYMNVSRVYHINMYGVLCNTTIM